VIPESWKPNEGYSTHSLSHSVFYVKIPGGGLIPPHGDDVPNRKNTILCGSGVLTVSGEDRRICAGDVYRFDSMAIHSVRNDGDVDLIILVEP